MEGFPGKPRRDFLHCLLAGAGLGAIDTDALLAQATGQQPPAVPETGSDVGTLWPLVQRLGTRAFFALSFTRPQFRTLDHWHRLARARLLDLLQYNPPRWPVHERVLSSEDRGDHVLEQVEFSTSPYIRVPATLLIPAEAPERQTPAVIAMHDHGGFYMWGREKLLAPEGENGLLHEFRTRFYAGRSPAIDLVRQGFVVVIIDMFYQGGRRMLLDDDPPEWRKPVHSMAADRVGAFNARSASWEPLVARTLFLAGTTWPGIVVWDDLRTVDYLISRKEVDRNRIGAVGFSTGGMRACMAGAIDPRIKVVAMACWMTSLPRQLRSKVRHSLGYSMLVPGLHRYMDLPDIAALIAPRPLLVMNGEEDDTFDAQGVARSLAVLQQSYAKGGAEPRLHIRDFPSGHVYSEDMQQTALQFLTELL